MYQFSYAEVLDETPQGARERERQALDRSIELLEAADKVGVRSREAIEALLFVRRLWSVLIEDLADPENDLPQALAHRQAAPELVSNDAFGHQLQPG